MPSYPSGSYNFVRRLRSEAIHLPPTTVKFSEKVEESENETPVILSATISLSIAIVGAGVGGLANAIALKRYGHNVTVYEQAPELSEVGT